MRSGGRVRADELDKWVRRRLPQRNVEIEQSPDLAKHRQLEELCDELANFTAGLTTESTLFQQDDDHLLEVLGNLGFILASCARHGIPVEHPKLSQTLDLVHRLGLALGHPPRDTLYTYVISNTRDERGRYRAFTLHADEQTFIDLTRQALDHSERALEALQGFQSTGCRNAFLLDEALRRIIEYQGCFHAFEMKDRSGRSAMEPDFFYKLFRDYFPTFELSGKSWGPPTAANAAPVIISDFVLGLADDAYRTHISTRLRYFTPHDQFRIRQAMQSPSILDELVQTDSMNVADLAAQITALRREDVANHFLEFVRRFGGASSTHYGLLKKYLEKPAQAEERELQARLVGAVEVGGGVPSVNGAARTSTKADTPLHAHVVDPKQGASGMQFPEVWSIRNMRVNNPKVLLLRAAMDLLASP